MGSDQKVEPPLEVTVINPDDVTLELGFFGAMQTDMDIALAVFQPQVHPGAHSLKRGSVLHCYCTWSAVPTIRQAVEQYCEEKQGHLLAKNRIVTRLAFAVGEALRD